MIHDGQRYQICRTVLPLPRDKWEGDHNYVTFGRLCKKSTPGAVKTTYRWHNDDFPRRLLEDGKLPEPDGEQDGQPVYNVWVKPIKSDGHSLTNLMYGKDGYSYYLYKGQVYIRRWRAIKHR